MDDWQQYWYEHSRSSDTEIASVADNCRFDERVSTERWGRLLSEFTETIHETLEWQKWCEVARTYMEDTYSVSSVDIPDALRLLNRQAWLTGIEENQTLVRIEHLGRAIDEAGYTLRQLNDFVHANKQGDDDANVALREFVDLWNVRRDGRPAFAAFLDEVNEEADTADWMHALRDRLGLGHYEGDDSQPIPVAQMVYPASAVIASATAQNMETAFALPTVLDAGTHPYYFPVPSEQPFGAALHLDSERADVLTAEVLHCRINYLPEHIQKVGFITIGHTLENKRLRDSRDMHLLALRDAANRADFGEMFDGRV